MLPFILLAILTAAVLYGLHYGYSLAFHYDDPQNSPYEYGEDEQLAACKALLNQRIAEYEAAPCEEVSIQSHDGLTLYGRYFHTADGAPLEIQCHGYKGNAYRDFAGAFPLAKEAGRNVLLIDERSHGKSQGHTITFGILERRDCMAWIAYANQRFGNPPIIISGVSMGAATVLMASGMDLPENVKGVIADCPYDAPANIIKTVGQRDMGLSPTLVYPLIRMGGRLYGHFDLEETSPIEAVKAAKVPILLIHGDDDRFVPYEMSVRIHAAAPEKITFVTIPRSGHAINSVTDPEGYRAAVTAFLNKIL